MAIMTRLPIGWESSKVLDELLKRLMAAFKIC
jgi:hypothetical protein